MAKFSRKQIIVTAGAAVVLLAAAAIAAVAGIDDGSAAARPGTKNYAVYKDDRTIGSPNAPVVMIEYAAPSCPHCAHFNITILPQIKKDYIDTGKVLYVLRVYPISPADGAVELIARCLPKEKYFPYIDFMFHNQPKWDPEYGIANVHEALAQLSGQMGVSAEMFDRCLANKEEPDRINRVAQDGQMRYGVNGVPTIVLNGMVVQSENVADWPSLKARLDAILAK